METNVALLILGNNGLLKKWRRSQCRELRFLIKFSYYYAHILLHMTTDKCISNIIHIITRILIDASLCVLNFSLPTRKPNFADFFAPHQRLNVPGLEGPLNITFLFLFSVWPSSFLPPKPLRKGSITRNVSFYNYNVSRFILFCILPLYDSDPYYITRRPTDSFINMHYLKETQAITNLLGCSFATEK
jgi:hypothetical protein